MSSGDSKLAVSEELRTSIELFFNQYGQAFASLNAEAVVSFFAMPFYVELDGDSLVWSASEGPGLFGRPKDFWTFTALRASRKPILRSRPFCRQERIVLPL